MSVPTPLSTADAAHIIDIIRRGRANGALDHEDLVEIILAVQYLDDFSTIKLLQRGTSNEIRTNSNRAEYVTKASQRATDKAKDVPDIKNNTSMEMMSDPVKTNDEHGKVEGQAQEAIPRLATPGSKCKDNHGEITAVVVDEVVEEEPLASYNYDPGLPVWMQ